MTSLNNCLFFDPIEYPTIPSVDKWRQHKHQEQKKKLPNKI